MNELSTRALYFLAEVSLRILALGLLVIPAAWLASRRRPELAHALWAALLVAMLVLPVLTPLLPPVYFAKATAEPIAIAPPLVFQLAAPPNSAPLPAQRPSRTVAWPVLLLAAYTAVAATLLLRVAARVRRTGRILAAAKPLRDDRLTTLLAPLALAQGRGFPLPVLCESGTIEVPFAAGWREPTIALPAAWRTWDDQKLTAVLAHELAHIQRHDWPASVFAALNASVFFFHPLAWLAERRLNALAEACCDAAALEAAGDPRHYASIVFDFAARLPHRAIPATAMARSSKVGARIERLLAQALPAPRPMKPLAWSLLLAATLPVLYAAASIDPGQEPLPPVTIQRQAESPHKWNSIPGANTTAQQAAELEQRLAANPQDLEARTQLIGYYFSNGYLPLWLKHLEWAIDNHPEAALHETYPGRIAADRTIVQDEAAWQRIQNLWRRKAIENPANVEVLLHAVAFLQDRDETRRLLETARAIAPSDPRPLGVLAGRWVFDIFGLFIDSPERNLRARQALEALLESRDADLVGTVGNAHNIGGLLVSQRVPPEQKERHAAFLRDKFSASERLLERAIQLDPQNPKWPEALAKLRAAVQPAATVAPQPEKPKRITMGGGVAERNLLEAPASTYPPLARQARIQGDVRFTLVITAEGDVSQLQLVSGHPLLVQAASDAVKNYRYRPTLLNGQPVEVVTQVVVPFRLHD